MYDIAWGRFQLAFQRVFWNKFPYSTRTHYDHSRQNFMKTETSWQLQIFQKLENCILYARGFLVTRERSVKGMDNYGVRGVSLKFLLLFEKKKFALIYFVRVFDFSNESWFILKICLIYLFHFGFSKWECFDFQNVSIWFLECFWFPKCVRLISQMSSWFPQFVCLIPKISFLISRICPFDFWNNFFLISKICPFDFSNEFLIFKISVWFLKWNFGFRNLSFDFSRFFDFQNFPVWILKWMFDFQNESVWFPKWHFWFLKWGDWHISTWQATVGGQSY